MGADRWGVCPRCRHNKQQEVENLEQELAFFTREQYGKVPLEQYQATVTKLTKRARDAANELDHMEPDSQYATFPEYYEFYTDLEAGHVVASFGAECRACGYNVNFEYKHPLPPF